MNSESYASNFYKLRETVIESFKYRSSALLNLVDSLCSNVSAGTPTQLSLNLLYERSYSSISDSVAAFEFKEGKSLAKIASPLLEAQKEGFHFLAVDVTPYERPYSPKVEDRGYIYKPAPVKGVKPISIGHNYSFLNYLPPKKSDDPPLSFVLDVKRVRSDQLGAVVGAEQIVNLVQDPNLPFRNSLTMVSGDTAYGSTEAIKSMSSELENNLVLMARVSCGRSAFKKILHAERPVGHPKWYGEEVKLNDQHRRIKPDLVVTFSSKTKRGKPCDTKVEIWRDMIFRGNKNYDSHNHPFTLFRIQSLDASGNLVFRNPMCLGVYGKRRDEVEKAVIKQFYLQRFDIEHFFRFGKRNLLLNKFQTPDVEHEEAWVTLVSLANTLLISARDAARDAPNPWEKYKKKEPQNPPEFGSERLPTVAAVSPEKTCQNS